MKYQELLDLTEDKFRRLTGVKPATLSKMLAILTVAHSTQKSKDPLPNCLEISATLVEGNLNCMIRLKLIKT